MSKLQTHSEILIEAPVEKVWATVREVDSIMKISPGTISISGTMHQPGDTRTSQFKVGKKTGTMTEKLLEIVPLSRLEWTIVESSFGEGKMYKNFRYVSLFEQIDATRTKLISRTYYDCAGGMVKLLNFLVLKRYFRKSHEKILKNIKVFAESTVQENS